MKTETIIYIREASSSAGSGWISGTAAPDSLASQIKNCTIVRQTTFLVRGNRPQFSKDEGSVPDRSQLSPTATPAERTQE